MKTTKVLVCAALLASTAPPAIAQDIPTEAVPYALCASAGLAAMHFIQGSPDEKYVAHYGAAFLQLATAHGFRKETMNHEMVALALMWQASKWSAISRTMEDCTGDYFVEWKEVNKRCDAKKETTDEQC